VVVLIGRGNEGERTPLESAALTLDTKRRDRALRRSRHTTGPIIDQISLRQPLAPERARTVVACVSISSGLGPTLAAVSGSLAEYLGTFVRQDDRICMIGAGRVVVMFHNVDVSTNAHVLGARLARSAAQSLEQSEGREACVTVGLADGDAADDAFSLTCAAIRSVEQTNADTGSSSPAVIVLNALAPVAPQTNGHTQRHERRFPPVALGQLNGHRRQPASTVLGAAVLVVDTAPPSPGVPGPAAAAVRSILEGIGLTVAATLAPALSPDPSLASLAGSAIRDSIALLVVHPGNGTKFEEDKSEPLERPAALAQLFRRTGMRVLAVGVGASDITLAECVLQGAEGAFALGELPDEIAHALAQGNGEGARADGGGAQCEHGTRADRLGKLLSLTKSERRVLYHLTTGATAIEIAENLVLSLATVRSHIRSILRKLEVSSQLAAVAIAQGHPARPAEVDHERNLKASQQAGAGVPQR
jgi:DNA-binding CsgD family transcriptional regulator